MFHPLSCPTIIYRAILRKNWIDKHNNRVTSAPFFRRPSKDIDGLSVHIAGSCSLEEIYASFNQCFGVVSLHVGHIRDIGLDVSQDSISHANIIGLPYKEEDLVTAERLAGLLARQSRFVS